MHHDCQECQRLWREYGKATTAHVALESKLRLAALNRETENIASLTLKMEDAWQDRQIAREAIRQHEAAVGHGDDTQGAPAGPH